MKKHFFPVAKITTICILISVVAACYWPPYQMDVKNGLLVERFSCLCDGDIRSDPPRSYKVYERSRRRNTDQAALWLDDSYPGFDRKEIVHPPLVHHCEGIRRLDFAESHS